MRMDRWGGWIGALALVGVLVGCGGAGNGGDSDGETPPLTDTPEAPGVLDGGTEGGGDAGTGGGGGTGDGGTGSDGDGGLGGGGGASTGGQLGWGRENGYVGNAWNFKAMEGARDGSFAVWTFCLNRCERKGETPRSRVDKLQGFRADGTPAWSMDFPRAMNVLSVEVSPSGRVIVGASYDRPADVAGTRVPAVEPEGGGNLYVLVLSPEGEHLWSRGFKAESRPLTINRQPLWQLRVAADDSDHVVLAGRWTGTLNLGGEDLGSMEDEDSFFFAGRLDARGEHLWSRSLKGEVTDGILSVEAFGTDAEGNLVLGGTAEAPDSGKYDHRWDTEGGEPYALALSAADGSTRWEQVLKGTRGALTSVARTPAGGLAFAGSYLERGFTFAGESLPEPRGIDALLLAVTADGEPRWARTFRGSSKEEQPHLVSDDLGHLTLGVVTDGTLDLGGEVFEPRPRKEPRGEVYLARYDAEGRHVWSRLVGNHTRFSSAFFAYGIVAQPDGSATYGVQMTRASPVEVDGRTFNVEPDTAQLFLQFRH